MRLPCYSRDMAHNESMQELEARLDRDHEEAVRRQQTLAKMTLAQRARFEAAVEGVIITR